MSATSSTAPGSGRRQWLALLTYVIVLVGLLVIAVASISNLLDLFAALNDSRATLARLDRQLQRSTRQDSSNAAAIDGPPFLSGKTITVAGAALQERVEAAVKKAGGNVLSSQIDLQGPHSAEGLIGLTESLEIDQASLQPVALRSRSRHAVSFRRELLRYRLRRPLAKRKATPMRVL